MASFVLSLFPLDVLDGIWDLTESVSEGFLTYAFKCLIGCPKYANEGHTVYYLFSIQQLARILQENNLEIRAQLFKASLA